VASSGAGSPDTRSAFLFTDPLFASSRELTPVIDKPEELKPLTHITRHPLGSAVEASGQPFGFYPR
jgi:hypothetical protein